MPASKMQLQRKVKRQAQVGELYLLGMTQLSIAAKVGVSQMTVSKDLKELRENWVKEGIHDFNEAKAVELAKLDHLEMLTMEAYQRSCQDRVEHRKKVEMAPSVKLKEKPKKGQRKDAADSLQDKLDKVLGEMEMVTLKEVSDTFTVGQTGDPRFLSLIKDIIVERCKIRGIYQEEPKGGKVNNGMQVIINLDQLSGIPEDVGDDPVEAKIKALGEAVPDAEVIEKETP